MAKKIYYFAYGSNMAEERMTQRGVKVLSKIKGVLKGYKLVFNKIASGIRESGYANIIKSDNDKVEGIVYLVENDSIKYLDAYEGIKSRHYYKDSISISTQNGEIECMVYVANQDKTKVGLKPTKYYLSHLLKGKDFFSKEYYNKLKTTDCIT